MVVLAPSPSQTVPKAHAVGLEEGSAGRGAAHLVQPRTLEMGHVQPGGLGAAGRHAEDAADRLPACWVLVGSPDQHLGQDERNAVGGSHKPATSGQPGETLP